MLVQAILPQYLHLPLKHVLVVESQQFLVGEVYAELLETVELEVLEPEDVQDVD